MLMFWPFLCLLFVLFAVYCPGTCLVVRFLFHSLCVSWMDSFFSGDILVGSNGEMPDFLNEEIRLS